MVRGDKSPVIKTLRPQKESGSLFMVRRNGRRSFLRIVNNTRRSRTIAKKEPRKRQNTKKEYNNPIRNVLKRGS